MFEKLLPLYIELLRLSWADAADSLGVPLGTFSLANENVKRILDQLATRVKDIDDTTRDVIRSIVDEGTAAGRSVDEIAAALRERAVTDSAYRSEMITRTESATAYEAGNHLAYAESGVVAGTVWMLGPEPCPECEAIGGKVVPLGEEFAPGVLFPPYHPNCTCSSSPVLT